MTVVSMRALAEATRDIAERIQARHAGERLYRDIWPIPDSHPLECIFGCDDPWPCPDRVAADALHEGALAQLAALDAAPYDQQHRVVIYPWCRLVPDPGLVSRDEQGDTT